MTRERTVLPVLVLFALMFAGFGESARAAQCLSYEPAKVNITGMIVRKIFPGPPEYSSIEEGDMPEQFWVLKPTKPICVNGDPSDIVNSEAEKNVTGLHLVLDARQYAKYKGYVSKQVVVSGTLFHAHTGHHRTRVLLEVSEIRLLKKKN